MDLTSKTLPSLLILWLGKGSSKQCQKTPISTYLSPVSGFLGGWLTLHIPGRIFFFHNQIHFITTSSLNVIFALAKVLARLILHRAVPIILANCGWLGNSLCRKQPAFSLSREYRVPGNTPLQGGKEVLFICATESKTPFKKLTQRILEKLKENMWKY